MINYKMIFNLTTGKWGLPTKEVSEEGSIMHTVYVEGDA